MDKKGPVMNYIEKQAFLRKKLEYYRKKQKKLQFLNRKSLQYINKMAAIGAVLSFIISMFIFVEISNLIKLNDLPGFYTFLSVLISTVIVVFKVQIVFNTIKEKMNNPVDQALDKVGMKISNIVNELGSMNTQNDLEKRYETILELYKQGRLNEVPPDLFKKTLEDKRRSLDQIKELDKEEMLLSIINREKKIKISMLKND